MNQILFTRDNYTFKKNIKNKKKLKNFRLQFFTSLITIVCSILYFLYFSYNRNEKHKISKNLLNHFNIEHIYSNSQGYTVKNLNNNMIIGIIEIPKINIKYPIFANSNDDLLKIAPCRFYGSYPNETGNLCIAAHNYNDNRFFSNLYKLSIGDKINIYDSNNYCFSYYIYDKFEITSDNDINFIIQNTNYNREITLITCNNINKRKLIVRAK